MYEQLLSFAKDANFRTLTYSLSFLFEGLFEEVLFRYLIAISKETGYEKRYPKEGEKEKKNFTNTKCIQIQ